MENRFPADGGLSTRVLFGAAAVAIVALVIMIAMPLVHKGPIVRTIETPAEVMSVISGRRATKYLVRMPDGTSMSIDGPGLPLYPAGSTVKVRTDSYANGARRHYLPR